MTLPKFTTIFARTVFMSTGLRTLIKRQFAGC